MKYKYEVELPDPPTKKYHEFMVYGDKVPNIEPPFYACRVGSRVWTLHDESPSIGLAGVFYGVFNRTHYDSGIPMSVVDIPSPDKFSSIMYVEDNLSAAGLYVMGKFDGYFHMRQGETEWDYTAGRKPTSIGYATGHYVLVKENRKVVCMKDMRPKETGVIVSGTYKGIQAFRTPSEAHHQVMGVSDTGEYMTWSGGKCEIKVELHNPPKKITLH